MSTTFNIPEIVTSAAILADTLVKNPLLIAALAASGDGVAFNEVDDDNVEQFFLDYTQEHTPSDAAQAFADGILDEVSASGTPTPSKIVGDLAQTSVTTQIAITGTTTAASAMVTAVSSTTGLAVGQAISGTGIAAGTTIAAIGVGSLTLSVAATGSGTGALSVTAEQQTAGLGDWTLDWKRKTVDSTTTDDGSYETSLGSTMSWSAKCKYMFIDSDLSQAAQILSALAVISVLKSSAQLYNFFPTISAGRAAFTGLGIVDGITITTGIGKVVGLDVSIKGTGPLNAVTQATPVATTTTTGLQAED